MILNHLNVCVKFTPIQINTNGTTKHIVTINNVIMPLLTVSVRKSCNACVISFKIKNNVHEKNVSFALFVLMYHMVGTVQGDR